MATKKKSTEKKETFIDKITHSTLLSSIVDILKIFSSDLLKEFAGKVEERLLETEKKILNNIFSAVIAFVGLIFIAIAAAMIIPQFIRMSEGVSYLIIGSIFVTWSLYIKTRIQR